jgi:eukaryotic-like serine/threonine-protein kinase
MALAAGTRLGAYEILAPLGSGGMGEVYRAHDTTLGRDVAIKILPEAFVSDPDRIARFEREARTLASLNHPHIAQIYGTEATSPSTGSGQAGGRALVMELVEGDTLADRIARGPVPLDEALPFARQIADALEAAHAHGIVHRDLKPANIKRRPDGTVKVLDFGLAKAADSDGRGRSGSDALANSPTAAHTDAGVILGTAAYMSPEQARGKGVDARSDIWAFGCVLFEMLTGRRAFAGETLTDVLAAVMKSDPNWGPCRPGHRPPSGCCCAAVCRRIPRDACSTSMMRGSRFRTRSPSPRLGHPPRRGAVALDGPRSCRRPSRPCSPRQPAQCSCRSGSPEATGRNARFAWT